MYKWIGVWEKPVKEFCKKNNISYIETAGRDGWTRVLQNKGYKKYYTVLVKEIKNDWYQRIYFKFRYAWKGCIV